MNYVSVVKTSDNLLLMTNRDGVVQAFQTETEGIRYYEDSYNRAHARSYEGSMSACINWIQFQPSIVGFTDTNDLLSRLIGEVPFRIVTAHSVAGSVSGIICKASAAADVWEKGTKPRLIG